MMKKSLVITLVLMSSLVIASFVMGGPKKRGYKVSLKDKPTPVKDGERPGTMHPSVIPHSGYTSTAIGPGTVLMESYYDYGSNGGVLDNLVYYDDGTISIARMGAAMEAPAADTPDRGTYFVFFDGTTFLLPTVKVEAERRGWSSISALADGREVTLSHVANEVNVDAIKGFGLWISNITGDATATRAIWPRLTVDGQDNIIICSTLDGSIGDVGNPKEIAISNDGGINWTFQQLLPDTSTRSPSFSADDQSLDSFGDKVAFAVSEFGGDVHLWESADNGATWTYRNLTNNASTIPAGTEEIRPFDTCDLIYDNAGNVHIFWEANLALRDSAGTGIDLFHDRDVGIQHWSEATGVTQVVSYSDIVGSETETDDDLFAGGDPFGQTNGDNTLTAQPQAGVDAEGNMYLLFCAYRPLDVDPADTTHFTDLYAVGSMDGGASWGAVVNVTDTEQSEEMWGSLYDIVDDNLRIVYQSDGNTGNELQGGGVAPTTFLYYDFPKASIPLEPTAVDDRTQGQMPTAFALHQNYPNPFNPTTQINFQIPTSGEVSLKVYNLVGQEVATLVDGRLNAGEHSYIWNAAKSLPSGVYVYKLESQGFSDSKKLVLMK